MCVKHRSTTSVSSSTLDIAGWRDIYSPNQETSNCSNGQKFYLYRLNRPLHFALSEWISHIVQWSHWVADSQVHENHRLTRSCFHGLWPNGSVNLFFIFLPRHQLIQCCLHVHDRMNRLFQRHSSASQGHQLIQWNPWWIWLNESVIPSPAVPAHHQLIRSKTSVMLCACFASFLLEYFIFDHFNDFHFILEA